MNTETGPQPALQFLSFAEKRVVHVAALDKGGPDRVFVELDPLELQAAGSDVMRTG